MMRIKEFPIGSRFYSCSDILGIKIYACIRTSVTEYQKIDDPRCQKYSAFNNDFWSKIGKTEEEAHQLYLFQQYPLIEDEIKRLERKLKEHLEVRDSAKKILIEKYPEFLI